MKLHEAVRARQRLHLRGERDLRAVNELAKVGARVRRVCAACCEAARDSHDQQAERFHASISRLWQGNTSNFYALAASMFLLATNKMNAPVGRS